MAHFIPPAIWNYWLRFFSYVLRSTLIIIPEQFTAIGLPSFIWRGGGRGKKNCGAKKLWGKKNCGTLSRGFGLRSFFLAGDLLWRPTLRIRIRIRIRILIYRLLKYWGSLISDENSSGRSLWKVFQWKWKWKCF